MAKPRFRKGQEFFHNESKEKVIFGKWKNEKEIIVMSKNHSFITILVDQFLKEYISYSQLEKKAKEKRRFQGW